MQRSLQAGKASLEKAGAETEVRYTGQCLKKHMIKCL